MASRPFEKAAQLQGGCGESKSTSRLTFNGDGNDILTAPMVSRAIERPRTTGNFLKFPIFCLGNLIRNATCVSRYPSIPTTSHKKIWRVSESENLLIRIKTRLLKDTTVIMVMVEQ